MIIRVSYVVCHVPVEAAQVSHFCFWLSWKSNLKMFYWFFLSEGFLSVPYWSEQNKTLGHMTCDIIQMKCREKKKRWINWSSINQIFWVDVWSFLEVLKLFSVVKYMWNISLIVSSWKFLKQRSWFIGFVENEKR